MIHSLADVQTLNIGANTSIWQFTVILPGAVIGENCNICCHCFIENDVVIGKNVTVKSGVQLWDGVVVEDDVFIGPNVAFTNDLVPRSKQYHEEYLKTILEKGCSIGANSTIIAGKKIMKYSFIGAGSVVTKDIPPYTVWYGNPAKQHGYITKAGVLLNLSLLDDYGDKYILSEDGEPVKKPL